MQSENNHCKFYFDGPFSTKSNNDHSPGDEMGVLQFDQGTFSGEMFLEILIGVWCHTYGIASHFIPKQPFERDIVKGIGIGIGKA